MSTSVRTVSYRPGNRFSPRVSIADAAVDWQGLSAEQRELVTVSDGIPFLAGVPDLSDRAVALLEAAMGGQVEGLVYNEDGYPLDTDSIRLQRDSVEKFIAATEARMGTQRPASADYKHEDRLIGHDEVLQRLGVSPSTLHRMVRARKFSEPHATGPKRWKLSYIDAWLASAGEPATK